jgi:hypothetical protein
MYISHCIALMRQSACSAEASAHPLLYLHLRPFEALGDHRAARDRHLAQHQHERVAAVAQRALLSLEARTTSSPHRDGEDFWSEAVDHSICGRNDPSQRVSMFSTLATSAATVVFVYVNTSVGIVLSSMAVSFASTPSRRGTLRRANREDPRPCT